MAMAEDVPHEDDEPDWVAIAQAEGMLSAREHVTVREASIALRARALAIGVPVDELARDLVRSARPGSTEDA
jgi:AmiR/NasT family two-component response regulator